MPHPQPMPITLQTSKHQPVYFTPPSDHHTSYDGIEVHPNVHLNHQQLLENRKRELSLEENDLTLIGKAQAPVIYGTRFLGFKALLPLGHCQIGLQLVV